MDVPSPIFKMLHSLSEKDKRDLVSLSLAFVTVLVYSPVIGFEFVNYDDPGYVYRNPHVHDGLSVAGLRWALTTLHGDVAYWHPLTWLSHQLDFQLFRFNAGAHHFTSVLLHSANTVIVFRILLRLTGQAAIAGLLALLFSIHPLRVESVAWVSERKDVLCAFFYLVTLCFYFRYASRPNLINYGLVLLSFVLAMMSKPMAVTLPFVLLLLDFWPLKRICAESLLLLVRGLSSMVLLEKMPFFALSGLGAWLAVWAQQSLGAIMDRDLLPVTERIANAIVSYASYLYKSILPINLSVHYAHPLKQSIGSVVVALVVVALVCAWAFRNRARHPIILLGQLCFIGILIPTVGIVQAGSQSMADRYTYLPTIGLLMMIAPAISAYQFSSNIPQIRIGTTLVVAIALIGVTQTQLRYWSNTQCLFERAIKVDPIDYVAHNNLGKEYERQGRINLAIAHFQSALYANWGAPYPNINMGNMLMLKGQPFAALPLYFRALKSEQASHLAHTCLARAYLKLGKIDDAIHHYGQALRAKPDYLPAKYELAGLLATGPDAEFRNGAQAVKLATQICQATRNRDPGGLEILAAAFAEIGEFKRAAEAGETAAVRAAELGAKSLERKIHRQLKLYYQGKPFHGGVILPSDSPAIGQSNVKNLNEGKSQRAPNE